MGGLLLLLLGVGCTPDEEVTWTQYNAEDNTVGVEVGAAELLPVVEVVLTSNTGTVEIGSGQVDPGGGPIDTLHTITVTVSDDYKDDIGRVSVRLDSGDRGEDEFDLDADSTGEGYWKGELRSVGEAGETRSDTLTFRLWQEDTSSSEDDSGA